MSIARDPLLLNPEAIPAQTAHDLAVFIYQLSTERLLEIFGAAEAQYKGPMNSWIWSLPYHLLQLRTRADDFSQAEILINERTVNNSKLTESQAFAPNNYMFGKDTGTWKEESANTLLMRELLKNMDGYDPSIQMSAQKLKELYDLLNRCISQRIELGHQLQAVESKLPLVRVHIEDINKSIKIHKDRITNILAATEFDIEDRKRWAAKERTYLTERQEQLKPFIAEETALFLEIEMLLNKIVELNPAFNRARLGLEANAMYTEAIKVGKAAADTAIREYILRVQDQEKRKQELAMLTAEAPKLAERKAMVETAQIPTTAEVDLGVSRVVQEAREDCLKSSAFNNDRFKNTLAGLVLLQSKQFVVQSPIPEKQAVIVKQSALMRQRQAWLEQSGLFAARPTAAPIAESSCSHQPRK